MPRRKPAANPKPATSPPRQPARFEQMEIFPEPVTIDRLDPRTVAGERTTATAIYRVTIGFGGEVHMVYHDRYGIYCEVHGRLCPAARAVQLAT